MGALASLLSTYQPRDALSLASTLPSAFYSDPTVHRAELSALFQQGWQAVCAEDAVKQPGDFLTLTLAGQPLLLVRGSDNILRGFFNVCRHHAAAVVQAPSGCAQRLRCPYHGWTYGLDGRLNRVSQFAQVDNFRLDDHGLRPVELDVSSPFVFVRLDSASPSKAPLHRHLEGIAPELAQLSLERFQFQERRSYDLRCNWKVVVDNYLDGGYHVPFLHKSLASVISNAEYTIETGQNHCAQRSPIEEASPTSPGAPARGGKTAHYLWLFPNFMVNVHGHAMDTNWVIPLGADRCQVVFDYYFTEDFAAPSRAQSIVLSEQIQNEDVAVCESVQRGLDSIAYDTGRLSVRREAGEHLFHRLLHAALSEYDRRTRA